MRWAITRDDDGDQAPHDPWAEQRRAMVQRQLRDRGIRNERVLEAMGRVPREKFVPEDWRAQAYADRALPVGEGQTISQPYMVAVMLEMLDPRPENRVLEIGAGSGYQAALLGELAGEVYTMEIVESLARRAEAILRDLGYENVHVICGDGSLGYPARAPYDRIIVAAAAPQVPPPLREQLAVGGRLVAPVGSRYAQRCILLERRAEGSAETGGLECVFVPLRGEHGWQQE